MVAKIDCMKNGYLVVPFQLPSSDKLKECENALHYMFVKKHQSKSEHEQRCLFLVNLPLLTHSENLKKSFQEICSRSNTVAHISQLLHYDEFGLNDVDLSSLTSDLMSTGDAEEKRFTPRNTALLQFVDDSSLENAWNALKKYSQDSQDDKLVTWSFRSPSMETFINFYKPLDTEYLKTDIHEHMALFEQREAQAQEEVQSSLVDEDGFTLVVGKNTKSLNSIRKKIFNRNPLLKHEKVAKPPSMVDKKAKQDFYRFQIREKKKQEISELLKKFKQDQERVKEMKSKRKFNPYS
ncbi:LAFE_0G01354g1_1 [Lachancea fermentati]|uniref:LAFE_0G01354g1_1 n=1 Tax=Lachancea fermentati TaxID=4955 RepID=A0A1G4MH28_LACFM|nr:LAFE_0G01354g1_1 [Lachancea fermentati]